MATLVFLFGSYWISELLIFSLVRRTPFFAPYYADKGIFNQDRLGTNIDMREVEEKRRFSLQGSSTMGMAYGDHATSSTIGLWLSVPLMGLIVLTPCSYCCTAKGVARQDTSILAPMVPMEPMGEATKTADAI